MLNVNQLTCERGQRLLFHSLAFSLRAGQGLQVLGGNGQGKSTLLRILVGLYSDYEGQIDWTIDRPPLYLGHRIGVKTGLTVLENIQWQAALRSDLSQRERIDTVLESLNLAAYRHQLCGKLSEGQRKRVGLAGHLLLDHSCWILDEPFSALDAEGVELLITAMNAQLAGGGAVMFTSHQPVELAGGLTTLELR